MIKLFNIFSGNKNSIISKDILKKYTESKVSRQSKILISDKEKKTLLCYAPFSNIYFNSQGQITACCRSSYIFDKYPDHDLNEIWFGEQFKKLRDPILNNYLSEACSTCLYQLKKGDFDNVMARIFDRNIVNKNKYPSVLEFLLTNTCNLECIMCSGTLSSSIRKNRDKMPDLQMLYDDKFIEQLQGGKIAICKLLLYWKSLR